jgi:hypothetical protein
MLVGKRRLVGLIAVAGALGALGLPARSLAEPDLVTLDVQVSGQGRIAATIDHATDGEDADVVCDGSAIVPATTVETARCPQRYRRDRVVILKAEPVGSSEFESWSDDRCPQGPVCKLVVDSNAQTIVATFSRQQVVVAVSNNSFDPGRITSTLSSAPRNTPPVPLTCDSPAPGAGTGEIADGAQRQLCHGEFPLDAEVKLNAEGVTPTWGSGERDDKCDAIVGAGCSLTLQFKRIVALNFGVLPPVDPYATVTGPNDVSVVFHVAKNGTGSGTVSSSDKLDCGDTCEAKLRFGAFLTLVADAKPGSRFVRWGGACAGSPRCRLAVGPVTRVTAVFDAAGESPVKPSGMKAPSKRERSGRRSRSPFVARVSPQPVVRGTRPRRILFRVTVNARSSIRAVLAKAHGRAVTSRSWNVQPGIRPLQLRVPKRAKPGAYVLRITARDGAGTVKRFQRRVRVRR